MNYAIKITLLEDMLGTIPQNKEIYEDYIATKKADITGEEVDEELATVVEKLDDKGRTGFHMLNGEPIIYDYVMRGFFKAACGALRRSTKSESHKVKAYIKVIDTMVFIFPRRISIKRNGEMGELGRSLRGETAQGPRVSWAISDTVPTGSTLEFKISVLEDKVVSKNLIEEWLAYGALQGLGQWRTGGYGKFTYEIVSTEETDIQVILKEAQQQ